MATEAENAVRQRKMKKVIWIAKTMSWKRSKQINQVKNKEGTAIFTETEERLRWAFSSQYDHEQITSPFYA